MNSHPYISYLTGVDVMRSLEETPRRIEALTAAWNEAGFERSYAAGKWTAREIVVHLAQSEIVLANRIRFTLAETEYVMQPFDQDRWMALESALEATIARAAYAGTRAMTLTLLRSLSAQQLVQHATHPEMGPFSVAGLAGWLAGHELHHLRQLETIASR